MELWELLGIRPGLTAVIGSGGKTSLLRVLAQELSHRGTVLVSTTTRIMRPNWCPFAATAAELCDGFAHSPIVCAGSHNPEGKLTAPDFPGWQYAADFVLVEADGSKRLPLKAHAPHEPVIPPEANQTILVVGASGFGRPMRESVHRAPIAAQALGVSEETVVTPELWAKFLNLEALHTRVLVNQAENEPERQTARALAAGLSCPVCMAALQKGWIECLC